MSIFETATRKKFRFPSLVGELTVEQLWDLPLVANSNRVSLDAVARAINTELKSVTEDSFVTVKVDPRKDELTLKLDVVKYIIQTKLAEQKIRETLAANAEKKQKILQALAAAEERELQGKSKEQLLAELEALS